MYIVTFRVKDLQDKYTAIIAGGAREFFSDVEAYSIVEAASVQLKAEMYDVSSNGLRWRLQPNPNLDPNQKLSVQILKRLNKEKKEQCKEQGLEVSVTIPEGSILLNVSDSI